MNTYTITIESTNGDGYTQTCRVMAWNFTDALAAGVQWCDEGWVDMEVTGVERERV
jgi:hypothetical protein